MKPLLSVLFLLFRAGDFLTTYAIISRYPGPAWEVEANPVPSLVLRHYGWTGLAVMTLLSAVWTLWVLLWACRKRPRTGMGGLWYAATLSFIPVAWNVFNLFNLR